jgi:N-acetylmuramoyl-L-alanine amidase
MTRSPLLPPFLLLIAIVVAVGCASKSPSPLGGGRGVSLSRDEWGHRPGPKGFRTVIIDAGHGGHDSGAVSRSGFQEKDLALDTARRLRDELSRDFNVVMMRDDDRFVDLDDRAAFASRYDSAILVSLHYNSNGSSSTGPEIYWWRVDSYSLAQRIFRELQGVASGRSNRGMVRRRLRLTRNPDIPCVLVEFGYLSNLNDARKCADPRYRARLAKAVATGIRSQAAKGDAGMGALPRPLNQPPSRATDPPGS